MDIATDDSVDEELKARAAEAFDVLALRLVRTATWLLPNAPRWLRSTLFCVVFLALSILGGLVLDEPRTLLILKFWAATLLFTNLIVLDHVGQSMLQILQDDIIPALPQLDFVHSGCVT